MADPLHKDAQLPGKHNGPSPQARTPRAPRVPGMTEFSIRVAVAVLIAILLFSLAFMAWRGADVLLEAFAGVLFAIFLSELSDWLSQKTGVRRGWALMIVVAGLVLVAFGTTWLLYNRLTAQLTELVNKLPQSFEEVRAYLQQFTWGSVLVEQLPASADSLTLSGVFSHLMGLMGGLEGFLEGVIIIIIVGIFGAAEPHLYRDGVLHLFPHSHRQRVREALDAIDFNLRAWIVGQIVLMIVIGITTAVGLGLIGVPLALALGVIAGILEIIPYIGPWISVIPAVLMAVLAGPEKVVLTVALYLALHVLEGYVMVPLIQQRAVHLPPALTLVSQFFMGKLAGILGLFVAAPLTVAIVILIKMLYVEDTLADTDVEVPGAPDSAHVEARQKLAREDAG